ncbi:hypothetical protein CALCODRAFT_506515 [Calocera cornea HHB12733]|uniref:Uncharacterized protein n=1 Tax=Calocera cornea HHB12733 TaxID=1353952 RepID=A0A165IQF9_9BASI|nr:hypothetical protein CALCODRAFT_506515 [Calocera cornea HHB12733]
MPSPQPPNSFSRFDLRDDEDVQPSVEEEAAKELGRFSVSDKIYNTPDGEKPVAGPSRTWGKNATRGGIRKRSKTGKPRTIRLEVEGLSLLISPIGEDATSTEVDWAHRKFRELEAKVAHQEAEIEALKQRLESAKRVL